MSRTDRILVTGASGFVGRHLTPALRRNFPAARIIGIGRRGRHDAPPPLGASFLDLDLAGAEASTEIEAFKPTLVFHLAGMSSIESTGRDAPSAVLANLMISVQLAATLRRCSADCVFVFAGSGESYGTSFLDVHRPLKEDAPLRPAGPYARAKTSAELTLIDLLSGCGALINLRLFNHTGPGQDERFVVPSFAAQIARIEAGATEPTLRVGNLDAVRDFLDIDDVIRAYVAIGENADHFDDGVQTFNISSGVGVAIREIVEELRRMATRPTILEVDTARLRPAEIPWSVGDSDLFRKRFDWSPRVPLVQTLERTLSYWRARL